MNVSTVKHDGESILVWGYFSISGADNLHFIQSILLKEGHINIIQQNLLVSERTSIQNSFIL